MSLRKLNEAFKAFKASLNEAKANELVVSLDPDIVDSNDEEWLMKHASERFADEFAPDADKRSPYFGKYPDSVFLLCPDDVFSTSQLKRALENSMRRADPKYRPKSFKIVNIRYEADSDPEESGYNIEVKAS